MATITWSSPASSRARRPVLHDARGMKRRFLDYIECRTCRRDFELVVAEEDGNGDIVCGRLRCARCGADYPILKGIPRFLPSIRSEADLRRVYADSFGHQWITYNWLRDEDQFEFY